MTRTFEIKIQNLDKLLADFNRAGKKLPDDVYYATVSSATLIQNEAKKTGFGRFKNQTGNLRRSIQKQIKRPASAVIFTDEKYAPYVEEGTRPHVITPKNKKFLAFKSGGRMVFAKKVNHPGSKPYPFFRPAFEENREKVYQFYNKAIDTAMRILSD